MPEVVFESQLAPDDERALREAILDVLANHPLFNAARPCPAALRVRVTFGMEDRTAINHSQYARDGSVHLHLNEFHFPLAGSNQGEPLVAGGRLHPRLASLLAHEFAHFIDARLTPDFGYDDLRRPQVQAVRTVHYHLWDSFIDGRLGDLAPHSLEEREAEARDVSNVAPAVIERAWRGEFNTYGAIIRTAEELTTPPGS